MKKISMFLVFVLLAVLLFVPVSANSLGDVNGNGRLEAADARLALRITVGLETYAPGTPQFAAADINGNGKVEAADARRILRSAVGLESLGAAQGKPLTSKEIYKMASAYTYEIRVSTDEYDAIGSGFAISADGLIVTNYHVIGDANTIQVFDYQNQELTVSQVVAFDRNKDLAILRVEGTLTPAQLNTNDYETGDTVYTLGSANGYTGTFANGVISNAAIVVPDYDPDMTFVQTSAPISAGNSGGPLIDEYGRVVAVNTMTDEMGQNLNFAIPSSYILALDRSRPMTVEAFSKAEYEFREIYVLFGEESVSMRRGGTSAYVFQVVSRQDYTLEVTSSSPALKTVLLTDTGYPALEILAAGECENAVVTVYLKEDPAVKKEFTVSVSPQGEISFPGAEGTPDFGAVTGVVPAAESFMDFYPYENLVYDGTSLLKTFQSAAAVRTAYEKALTEAGFRQTGKDSQLFGAVVTYTYQNPTTDFEVIYTENVILGRLISVTIEVW